MIEPFVAHLADLRPQVILDVGSWTGQEALDFKKLYPDARVFAFEAYPPSAEACRRLLAPHGVEVVEGAVHEIDGTVPFYPVPQGNCGASSLFRASGHQQMDPIPQSTEPIQVRARRLDAWAARQTGLTE